MREHARTAPRSTAQHESHVHVVSDIKRGVLLSPSAVQRTQNATVYPWTEPMLDPEWSL